MGEARCYHSAVADRDYRTITVFGGLNNNTEIASIETLSLETGEWKQSSRMRDPRCLHTAIACPP